MISLIQQKRRDDTVHLLCVFGQNLRVHFSSNITVHKCVLHVDMFQKIVTIEIAQHDILVLLLRFVLGCANGSRTCVGVSLVFRVAFE